MCKILNKTEIPPQNHLNDQKNRPFLKKCTFFDIYFKICIYNKV